MDRAEIYLRAAEMVSLRGGHDQNTFCCLAIKKVKGDDSIFENPVEARVFDRRFIPRTSEVKERYMDPIFPGSGWGRYWPSPKKCRVLALCFAAAMARTGDL